MKTSNYESILREILPKSDPLKERRDYGAQGMDALEQNAMALLDKGVKLPMMLEIRLRKMLENKQAIIKRCPKKNQDDRPKSEQQWCLFDSKGERLLGRHPSKEKALDQERAIQIHKHMK